MWYYNNKEFNETPEEYQGFVYEIRELSTNKKYIGKKNIAAINQPNTCFNTLFNSSPFYFCKMNKCISNY